MALERSAHSSYRAAARLTLSLPGSAPWRHELPGLREPITSKERDACCS
jgi:hypothetical protein